MKTDRHNPEFKFDKEDFKLTKFERWGELMVGIVTIIILSIGVIMLSLGVFK